ncbi:MAG: alpha/beta fold hydrolase, partial [Burkholderiaceae bacterium]
GHSMGGAVAARFVAGALEGASWSRPVDGLVLSSPALDAGLSAVQRGLLAATLPLVPHLAVGNGLDPSWISRSPAAVKAYREDPLVHNRITPTLARMIASFGPEVQAMAPRWALPTLLMWAGADRCVAPAGSAAFARVVSPEVLQAQQFPGLFHELINEPEREHVFTRLRAWLGARS